MRGAKQSWWILYSAFAACCVRTFLNHSVNVCCVCLYSDTSIFLIERMLKCFLWCLYKEREKSWSYSLPLGRLYKTLMNIDIWLENALLSLCFCTSQTLSWPSYFSFFLKWEDKLCISYMFLLMRELLRKRIIRSFQLSGHYR